MDDTLTKKCSICKKEKSITEFYKSKSGSLGVCGKCKDCEKEYRKNKKEHYSKLGKKYREENKEGYADYRKEYYKNNKESIQNYMKKYNKKYREKNKEKIRENQRKRRLLTNNNLKKRRQNEPLFKLKANLRTRVHSFMVGKYKKNSTTEELLGADFETVKKHIESTFKEGMSWENYGACKGSNCNEVWHIDHKIPLSSATTQEEVEKLFRYTNLQALWAFDNLSKGDKIIQ